MNLILDVLYVSNDRPCCPFWYIISGTINALSKRQTICEENTVLYLQNRSKEHSKIEVRASACKGEAAHVVFAWICNAQGDWSLVLAK
jgi:hypothetical protein